MVTTYTKTVGTTARDYSTLTLAEADIPSIATSADLVSNDEAVIFDCYNDSTFSAGVTVSGTTCDATRNVTFRAAAGEQHTGVRNTGVRVEAGTGHAFTVYGDHIVIKGLELKTGSNSSDECVRVMDDQVGVLIDSCLLERHPTNSSHDGVYFGDWSVGSATYPITVQNCLFQGFDRAGVHCQAWKNTYTQYCNIINCTFVSCGAAVQADADNAGTDIYVKIINCTADDGDRDLYEYAGAGDIITTGSANNFGSDVPDPFPDNTESHFTDSTSPGVGFWAIIVDYSGANWLVWDERLVDDSDSDVLDAGVGPSSNALVPTYDCVGTTRSGTTTDAGFYQVSGGAPPATRRIFVVSSWLGWLLLAGALS